jgi:hypothetical protein
VKISGDFKIKVKIVPFLMFPSLNVMPKRMLISSKGKFGEFEDQMIGNEMIGIF